MTRVEEIRRKREQRRARAPRKHVAAKWVAGEPLTVSMCGEQPRKGHAIVLAAGNSNCDECLRRHAIKTGRG